VIVNCAGRTRSIIGTQSLVNAGIPNPVAALRNGTIGWKLAGQELDHGASRVAPVQVDAANHDKAREGARAIAARAGVRRVGFGELASLHVPAARSTSSTSARPRNTRPAICRDSAARPVDNWCRRPTIRRQYVARASCWPMTMAYART
jgi:hypothetical protein